MSKQTYISCIENADGKMIDFNRWAYKCAQYDISVMKAYELK